MPAPVLCAHEKGPNQHAMKHSNNTSTRTAETYLLLWRYVAPINTCKPNKRGKERSEMISVVQLCGVSFLGSQLYSIAAVPYTIHQPAVAAVHTAWGKG